MGHTWVTHCKRAGTFRSFYQTPHRYLLPLTKGEVGWGSSVSNLVTNTPPSDSPISLLQKCPATIHPLLVRGARRAGRVRREVRPPPIHPPSEGVAAAGSGRGSRKLQLRDTIKKPRPPRSQPPTSPCYKSTIPLLPNRANKIFGLWGRMRSPRDHSPLL